MNTITRWQPMSVLGDTADLGSAHRGRYVIAAVVGLLSILSFSNRSDAQVYRGNRHQGAVVVAPPILGAPYGAPYYGVPWTPAPVIVGPPSRVRVQTPFFSLNIGPGGIVPPPYALGGYYGSFRPRYEYGYSYSTSRPLGYPRAAPDVYGQYRPGTGGGIPEVTTAPSFSAPPFSLQALRRAAETLRGTLERRPDDADVWLDYLQPDTIIADVVQGYPSASMPMLLKRYEGVTRNPDLAAVTRLRGFDQTLLLLATWLEVDGKAPAASNSPAPPVSEDLSRPDFPAKADDSAGLDPPAREEVSPGPSESGPRDPVVGF